MREKFFKIFLRTLWETPKQKKKQKTLQLEFYLGKFVKNVKRFEQLINRNADDYKIILNYLLNQSDNKKS